MNSYNKLRDYIKEAELRDYNGKIKVKLSKDLAQKYDQGVYDEYLSEMETIWNLIGRIGIKYPGNSKPEFYLYIVPDEDYAEILGIPEIFNNEKSGGKPVACQELDGFNYAYGTSQNLCENFRKPSNKMSFENKVHELAHLVHGEFFTESSIFGEGFAEALALYTLDIEDDFFDHKDALMIMDVDKIYTVQELINQERDKSFGKEALSENKSCSFRLSYISSYLFVRGLMEKIEEKFNLNRNESTQYFLEMIRQSNYNNEWLIYDIADHLEISREELLNTKSIQIGVIKRILQKEIELMKSDIEALEEQKKFEIESGESWNNADIADLKNKIYYSNLKIVENDEKGKVK